MLTSRRYVIFTIASLFVTLYVMTGEVYDRGDALVMQYMELHEKQERVLTPDMFARRKQELDAGKIELTMAAQSTYADSEKTVGGLFEYLNANAKLSAITVREIVPAEAKHSGIAKDVGFTMTIAGSYHEAAKFIDNYRERAAAHRCHTIAFPNGAIWKSAPQRRYRGTCIFLRVCNEFQTYHLVVPDCRTRRRMGHHHIPRR